jgi:hypothetical protein
MSDSGNHQPLIQYLSSESLREQLAQQTDENQPNSTNLAA